MASIKKMSDTSKGGVAVVVLAILGLIGWAIFDKTPAPLPVGLASTADPAAEATALPATPPSPDPTAPATEAVQLLAPTIDVLRVAPDGLTTLAGRTVPLSALSIEVDGTAVASVTADANGQFATVFALSPSAAAQMLTLVATLPDGTLIAAKEAVAIAPIAEPAVAVAAAEPALTDAIVTDAIVAEPAVAEPAVSDAIVAEPGPAEPAAPAAIKVTDGGAAVLQPSQAVPADIAAEVSLDVISYTAEGAVQLGGRGTAGATLHLYLDNVELGNLLIGADGAWSLTSNTIAPGLYTLRVDQLDAGGTVTSRLETPFKRETLEALAAASQTAASDAPSEPATPPTVPTKSASPETVAPETAATQPAAAAATTTQLAAASDATTQTGPAVEPAADAAGVTPTTKPVIAEPTAADTAPAASPGPITITVLPGFTLWAIAKKNLGNGVMYVQVFEANKDKIKDPDLIYPGQVFTVPASP